MNTYDYAFYKSCKIGYNNEYNIYFMWHVLQKCLKKRSGFVVALLIFNGNFLLSNYRMLLKNS